MKYTSYYEEREIVTLDKYGKVKLQLKEKEKTKEKVVKMKKIELESESFREEGIRFFLCIDDKEKCYLEKRGAYNQVQYDSIQPITKQMVEKIISQDIQWMKNHKKKLLNELYWQMSASHVTLGFLTEYETEILWGKSVVEVRIDKKIRQASGKGQDLFSKDLIMIDCLSEGKVGISYRRKLFMPPALQNLLQGTAQMGAPVFA